MFQSHRWTGDAPRTGLGLACFAALMVSLLTSGFARAQESGEGAGNEASRTKSGDLIDVPVPLTSEAASGLVDQLTRRNEMAADGTRVTVVLRYAKNESAGDDELGDETAFEDALRLARAITGNDLRQVRVVSWVEVPVTGHSVLPILASDLLLVGAAGQIADATAGESEADDTVALTYASIAKRRGLFPDQVVSALVDPSLELAKVSTVGGEQVFASGTNLDELRRTGKVLREEVWSIAGSPLRIDAEKLRSSRIAAGRVDSIAQAAELLDLAELATSDERVESGEAVGVLLELTGSIAPGRTRRWQSNLSSTLSDGDVNTWLISMDSIGGSLDDSATLAGWFASPEPPLRTVAGFVRGEARGDAALVAVACKPLLIKPDARLGGLGADSIDADEVRKYDELIEQIAQSTDRPAALLRGLLDAGLEVYRYTNTKTGRVRYATPDDIVADAANDEQAEVERAKWQRGERVDLVEGLSASEAIALGLADGEADSLEEASRRIGLDAVPPPISDRGLVRLVERLGRNSFLSFLLLFVGFAALSAEANAPGLSFPGFIALVCFGLFFWMKFLAGTAEWLELVALSLGIICIAIEVFVVPGFGVFGIGGLMLTVLGIVLMSQTFVVPRNVYQITLLTRGIWAALGGAAGMVGGFFLIRMMLPHVPLLNGLVMEAPDEARLSESEKLGDFAYLLGQEGVATTPLRPSGKARFDGQIVQVISDGSSVSAGDAVRVCQVQATRVVVEAVED